MPTFTPLPDSGKLQALRSQLNQVLKAMSGVAGAARRWIQNSSEDYAIEMRPDTDPSDLTLIQIGGKNASGVQKWGIRFNGQFVSKVPQGTPPMVIDSTTRVVNLNVDMVDGLHTHATGTGEIVATSGATTIFDKRIGNYLDFISQASAPANPPTDHARVYARTRATGSLEVVFRDATGAVYPLGPASGSSSDPVFLALL